MRTILSIFFFLTFWPSANGQVKPDHNPFFINDYTPVFSFNACENKMLVEDVSDFIVGDTVLIIQMKGALIDSSNTPAFGTITDYRNCGNFEFNYIKSISGNTVELKNNLTRQYDIPDGKVQLIRVPTYSNLITADPLTSMPWNGSTGGVLVFIVNDTLTLNANIDVSVKGFRGGKNAVIIANPQTCSQNGYYYDSSSWQNARKGEGITSLDFDKWNGRGRLANGGGGGNGLNSGGGGGSNSSVGGFGGYQIDSCNNPFLDNRGIGGVALNYSNTVNKIFLGGGGGAGHIDSDDSYFRAEGGIGGGIVILKARCLQTYNYSIDAYGAVGEYQACPPACHTEGMGGGGAGGTILLDIDNYLDSLTIHLEGGDGIKVLNYPGPSERVGPGGGGSGGVVWFAGSIPPFTGIYKTGGVNGVIFPDAQNPYGATPGGDGTVLDNLALIFDTIPFIHNIDSVRIKDSATSCSSFDFKGFGYTTTNPIISWQWFFGDGGTAITQNTTHTYTTTGTFTVKLITTDMNGCKDSITKNVTPILVSTEFSYRYIPCFQQTTVLLAGMGIGNWDFGDGSFGINLQSTLHTYTSPGVYIIKHGFLSGVCSDTTVKIFDATIIPDDIIFTQDTTICSGTTKQLLAQSSGNFCWSPATYLNNPAISNPITSTPGTITYFYKAETLGNNLIPNGDFSAGNIGFTSDYIYQLNNTNTTAAYGINTNSQTWNPGASLCTDHTSGTGNMFLANGATTPGLKAWKTTVPVTPNTNYQFSAWIQSISPGNLSNVAWLKVNMNDKEMPLGQTAPVTNCQWVQLKFNWNSGNTASADISLKDFVISDPGNDFALDDIFFGPVFLKRDSIKITVDTPFVRTINDPTVCEGTPIQLNATGAITYSWSPATGLSNPNISNPVATPTVTTRYIVTGINANGCTGNDTVNININSKPVITKSNDDTICNNSSIQLFASGGVAYSWSPAATLNNAFVPNPIATPLMNTTYMVTVTSANSCTNTDSIKISIIPLPVFTISAPGSICVNKTIQLSASGGDLYIWQPAASLDNPAILNPIASPQTTTTYSVLITETACNNSSTLSTVVTVLPPPAVQASKSNDIDCTYDQSQLIATGAVKYSWSPATTLNNPAFFNPVAKPTITTQYVVKGTDQAGCINFDSITVKVLAINKSGYLMPSGFTPNNDGLNDCYGIKYWGLIQELDFSIFNRWGERVFHTRQPGQCWDGRYKNILQTPAVFVYMIKAKTNCGDVFRKGTFTLIR